MSWYYIDSRGHKQGPYTIEQLLALCRSEKLNAETLVWQAGMQNWARMAELPSELGLPSISASPAKPAIAVPVGGGSNPERAADAPFALFPFVGERYAELLARREEEAKAQAECDARTKDANDALVQAAAWLAKAPAMRAEVEAHKNLAIAMAIALFPTEISASFDDALWDTWRPRPRPAAVFCREGEHTGTALRMGHFAGVGSEIPSFVPLIGADVCIVVRSDANSDAAAKLLLHALVLRLAAQLPHQARFTLVDPVGFGRTFPIARSLPCVRELTEDLSSDLRAIRADIRRLMKDVVAFHGRFDALPAEVQASERYEFIIATDFPKARVYDRRTIESLSEISQAGPRAGRYLILHWSADAPMPREAADITFHNIIEVDVRRPGFVPDCPPDKERSQRILSAIANSKPTETSIGIADLLPGAGKTWAASSAEALVAIIGRDSRELAIRFDEQLNAHALITAAPGGGKSNLLHSMLLSLATHYAPDELELYLVDLKEGVEFAPYRKLPHARVVSLNTRATLARAVVEDLCAEMKRRLDMFLTAQVQSLSDYRRKGSPGGTLPRIVLVVDEYQQLFTGNADELISEHLALLVRQGRAPGVHIILASQTAGAPPGMLNARGIMDGLMSRIVLRMKPEAIAALVDFGPQGKELIRSCDRPGKVVVNDMGGQDGSSRLGKVALVTPEARDETIAGLARLAQARGVTRQPQVFDGNDSPTLAAHELLKEALLRPRDAAWLIAKARMSWSEGGFGRDDWREHDRPIPLWIGRRQRIYGHATALLTRRDGGHLLLVGGASEGLRGMLAGVLASLEAIAVAAKAVVELMDVGASEPLADAFDRRASARAVEVTAYSTGPEISQRLQELAASLPNAQAISRVIVLINPDDANELRRPLDSMARDKSPGLEALKRILADGPRAGLHLVIALRSPRAASLVFDDRRGDLRFIRWRAAVQMSDDDSRRLFDQGSAASRLEARTAVLHDLERAEFERFMPYQAELESGRP